MCNGLDHLATTLLQDAHKKCVGKRVMAFFRIGAALPDGDFHFAWPAGIAPVTIPARVARSLRIRCARALHVLTVTRDAARLVAIGESASDGHAELIKRLPRWLSSEIDNALTFFEERLKLRSGVDELRQV